MWIPESLPVQLRKLRQGRGLSQRAVSLQSGLIAARISDFERGTRTPRSEALEALAGAIGFDAADLRRRTSWQEPSVGRPEGDAEKRFLSRFSPDLHDLYVPPRRKDFAFHMAAVRARFADLLKVLEPRIDALPRREELELFLRDLPVDSADEAAFDIHVAAFGATTGRVSPASLGFFAHAVIDPVSRLVVGHRRRQVLGGEFSGAMFALAPQVAVRPCGTIIMDSLAGVREGTTSFIDVEVDGSGHDPERDEERTRRLGLPVLRVETEMLQDALFMPRFLRTLLWMHRNSFQGVVRRLED